MKVTCFHPPLEPVCAFDGDSTLANLQVPLLELLPPMAPWLLMLDRRMLLTAGSVPVAAPSPARPRGACLCRANFGSPIPGLERGTQDLMRIFILPISYFYYFYYFLLFTPEKKSHS